MPRKKASETPTEEVTSSEQLAESTPRKRTRRAAVRPSGPPEEGAATETGSAPAHMPLFQAAAAEAAPAEERPAKKATAKKTTRARKATQAAEESDAPADTSTADSEGVETDSDSESVERKRRRRGGRGRK